MNGDWLTLKSNMELLVELFGCLLLLCAVVIVKGASFLFRFVFGLCLLCVSFLRGLRIRTPY